MDVRLAELFVVPVIGATVGRRPWITAIRRHPRARMTWRVAAGASADAAAREIAARLRDGTERPLIAMADWLESEDLPGRGW